MPPPVISVENLSKVYRLGSIGSTTLREDLSRGWARLRGKSDPTLKVGAPHNERRDGDVFCIPRGYHGPSVAPPGYPLYYLNVLAGPGGTRSMAFCDDPAHHWIRAMWEHMEPDPRCPMTDASGMVRP